MDKLLTLLLGTLGKGLEKGFEMLSKALTKGK